jgi:hypothetical protein
MEVVDKGIGALMEALFEQGFRAVDEFDSGVTLERADDSLKIHVSPDGSFAAFNEADELIAEGEGQEDLYRMLMTKPLMPPSHSRRRDRRHRPNSALP